MSNPKLFVHCGLHKTASTFMQFWLGRHQTELARQGLYIPKTGNKLSADEGFFGAHHHLAYDATRSARFTPAGGTLNALQQELQEVKGDVLISSEEFSPLLRRRNGMAPLQALAQATGRELVVVVYLRHQASYVAARFMQIIKSRNEHPEFGSLLDVVLDLGVFPLPLEMPVGLDYAADLDRLQEAGISCRVRNFHQMQGSPLDDLLICLEKTPLEIDAPDQAINQGNMSDTLSRFLSTRLTLDAELTQFLQVLEAHLPLSNRLSGTVIAQVTERFADSNARLLENWGVDLSPGVPKPADPATIPMDLAFSHATQEQVSRLLANRFEVEIPGFFDRARANIWPQGRKAQLAALIKRFVADIRATVFPKPSPFAATRDELTHWETALRRAWNLNGESI